MSIEVMKMALEALEAKGDAWVVLERKAKVALRQAIEQAEQQEGTVMAEYKFQTYAAYKKDGETKIGVVPEPEQEPVAWRWKERINGDFDSWVVTSSEPPPYAIEKQPLYTTPPPRKPLTDEEIAKIASTPCAVVGSYVHTFARAIEAAHGIGEKHD
jgi:hypothetical protein